MCAKCDQHKKQQGILREAGHVDIAEIFATTRKHYKDSQGMHPLLDYGTLLDLVLQMEAGYASMVAGQCRARYLDGFDVESVPNDGHRQDRVNLAQAVLDLYAQFGARLPWHFYGGYLSLAVRENDITVAERLPDLAESFPSDLDWRIVDSVWHGLPPVTALYLNILQTFVGKVGRPPLHDCGCNHMIPPRPDGTWILSAPPLGNVVEITEVALVRILAAMRDIVLFDDCEAFGITSKRLRHEENKGERSLARILELPDGESVATRQLVTV